MMRLPTKKRLRKAKEKTEKPEFSRLFGHGADDGIWFSRELRARSSSVANVHRKFALHRFPFKSHHPYKAKWPRKSSRSLVRMTGFEPTRLSTLEPDGNDTLVEDYFLIKSYAFFKSS